ncbi:MAG: biotin transporter BioY [Selenomonadaceae bacterium]
MKNKRVGEMSATRTMTKMAICVALLCVSAYISFPLPFTAVMVTALTIVMNLSAFILTPKQTFIVMLVYTLLGCIGLPVFVGGTAGFGKLFGPTGGFIIVFVIAYPIVSFLKGTKNSFKRYLLIAVAVGIPITYIGGIISMMLVLQINLWSALVMAVFPFIPGDIFKAVAAAYLGAKLNTIFAQWI